MSGAWITGPTTCVHGTPPCTECVLREQAFADRRALDNLREQVKEMDSCAWDDARARDRLETDLRASQATIVRLKDGLAKSEAERWQLVDDKMHLGGELNSVRAAWNELASRYEPAKAERDAARAEVARLRVLITHLITAWDSRSVPGYTVAEDVLEEARRVAADMTDTRIQHVIKEDETP